MPAREIAEAIGRGLNVPVASLAPQDAFGHFGWLSMFFTMDIPAQSTITQELLGWAPCRTEPWDLAPSPVGDGK